MDLRNPLPQFNPQQSLTGQLLSEMQAYNNVLRQETFLPPERKVEFDTALQDYNIPDIQLPNE